MSDKQKFTYEHGGAVLPKEGGAAPNPVPPPKTTSDVSKIIAESLANRSREEEQAAAVVQQVMSPAPAKPDAANAAEAPAKEVRLQSDSAMLNQPKATFDFGSPAPEPKKETAPGRAEPEPRAAIRAEAPPEPKKEASPIKAVSPETVEKPAKVKEPKERPEPKKRAKKTEENPVAEKKEKKGGKKVRGWMIAVACVALVVVAAAALQLTGILTFNDVASMFAAPEIKYYTYKVNSQDDLVRYIKHPALKPGDTLELSGDYIVDVDLDFGGYTELPLINLTGTGSLKFQGGMVVLTGSGSDIDMGKANFDTDALYIIAPETNLKLGSAPDANINVLTLNGSPHTKEIDAKLPGMVFSVPVTITNMSASALTDAEVHLTSASFIFPDGNTTVVPSLAAGQSVEVNVNVMATEAGRPFVAAYAVDAAGTQIVSGKSAYINVVGGGYYGGDTHTHSVDSHGQHFSTTEENIKAAYKNGLSYIYSVENEEPEKYYTQEEVNGILGAANSFLQLKATEQIGHVNHLLIYDSEVMPPFNYDPDSMGITYWYYQDSINQVVEDGGFVILPHFFYASVETPQQQLARTSRNITAIEILTLGYRFEDIIIRVPYIVWDNYNVRGLSKVFGVFSSNNLSWENIGRQYIKGYLPMLTEEYVSANLRSGNYFMSNGPELRFTLADKMMGQDIYVPRPLSEGETLPEGVVAPITTATAKIYASDIYPLTKVRLLKFFISGNIDAIEPEVLYEEDFTGKGVFEKYIEVPVDMEPDTYYRVEVYSERGAIALEDIGVALSNPIYCYSAGTSSAAALESVTLSKGKLEIQQAPNGTRYIVADREIGTNNLNITANTPNYYVEYHKNSGDMADYINIVLVTQSKTYVVERIYVFYTE